MQRELTIKTITQTDTKKDGTKLTGKYGPYWMVRIDTEEDGQVTLFSKNAVTLKAGDKITGTIETSVTEKDGKTYTNKTFSFPKKNEGVDPEDFRKLSNRVTTLEVSFERKFAELKASIKSDVVLDMTGKIQTDKDYQSYTSRHPMQVEKEYLEDLEREILKDADDMPF